MRTPLSNESAESARELAFVSVVMPARNAAKTIEAAIRSVLTQTRGDFELLIIDDASEDMSADIAERFAAVDPRVRVFRNERNVGAAASRNLGVSAAKGEWIAFLDSDDIWRTDKLEKQMAFIRETGAAISCTATAFMDEDGAAFGYVMPVKHVITRKDLLRANTMSCSSVIVRRELMTKIKMPGDAMHEDYAAWLGILRETGRAYGLNDPLLTYRVSKNSKSGNRVKSAAMVYKTYRHVGYYAVAAALLTLRYSVHSIAKWSMVKRSRPMNN